MRKVLYGFSWYISLGGCGWEGGVKKVGEVRRWRFIGRTEEDMERGDGKRTWGGCGGKRDGVGGLGAVYDFGSVGVEGEGVKG